VHTHATVRRSEGVDASRTSELKRKVNETLIPHLNKIDGFKAYYLLEAGNGVLSSFSMFDNSAHADEATKLVANWVRAQKNSLSVA
jgi:hypothetical protein